MDAGCYPPNSNLRFAALGHLGRYPLRIAIIT